MTVNHSIEFVNPETWAHTQTIESNWRAMKLSVMRGGIHKEYLAEHLCEYLWRRDVKRSGADLFLKLINDISKVYPAEKSV